MKLNPPVPSRYKSFTYYALVCIKHFDFIVLGSDSRMRHEFYMGHPGWDDAISFYHLSTENLSVKQRSYLRHRYDIR